MNAKDIALHSGININDVEKCPYSNRTVSDRHA
jgi:hypothetical protein